MANSLEPRLKQIFDSYSKDWERKIDRLLNFYISIDVLQKLTDVIFEPLGAFFDDNKTNNLGRLDIDATSLDLYIYYTKCISGYLETAYGKDKAVFLNTILHPVINPYGLYGFTEGLFSLLDYTPYKVKLQDKFKASNLETYSRNVYYLLSSLEDKQGDIDIADLEFITFEYFDNRIYYVLITKYLYDKYHSDGITLLEWHQGINKIADDNSFTSITNLYIVDFDLYNGYSKDSTKPIEVDGVPTINIPLLNVRTSLEKKYGPLTVNETKLLELYNDFLSIPTPTNVYNYISDNYLDSKILSLFKKFNDFIKSLHLEQLSNDQSEFLETIMSKCSSIIISWTNMFNLEFNTSASLDLDTYRTEFLNKTRLEAYTKLDLIKYYEINPLQEIFDKIQSYHSPESDSPDTVQLSPSSDLSGVTFVQFLQKPINSMKRIQSYSNNLSKKDQFIFFDELVFRPMVKFYLNALTQLSYSPLNRAIDGVGDYRGEPFLYLKRDLDKAVNDYPDTILIRDIRHWMSSTFTYRLNSLFSNFIFAGISYNYSSYIDTVYYSNLRLIKSERNLEFSRRVDEILKSMDDNLSLVLCEFFKLPKKYPAYIISLYSEFLNQQYPGWLSLLDRFYYVYRFTSLTMPSRLSLFFPRFIYSVVPISEFNKGRDNLTNYKGAYQSSANHYTMFYIFYPDLLSP